ncbi:MAG TPA: hypothetical protein VK474_04985, partial [Chthoniobacterales bacterium]|nr:hypothetical protein [Chthoniobacterales bacterium]
MILLAHPFGNANVRAVLQAFLKAELLAKFVTTVGYPNSAFFLSGLPAEARRRGYDLPPEKMKRFPARELVRLFARTAHAGILTR